MASWLEGERRDGPRITLGPLDGVVRLSITRKTGGGPIEARLVDFSRQGARFRAGLGFEPGSRVSCRAVLETAGAETVEFEAEVRWSIRVGEGEHDTGVRVLGGGSASSRLLAFERFVAYQRGIRGRP